MKAYLTYATLVLLGLGYADIKGHTVGGLFANTTRSAGIHGPGGPSHK